MEAALFWLYWGTDVLYLQARGRLATMVRATL